MDSLILWIVVFSALGGVLSVFAAAGFLLVPEATRARLLSPMVSFAIGALLGAAFLAILPHAFETPGVDAHQIALTVLCGIPRVAVIAHEIPQELGDFAILLHSGYSRARALLYNALTGLTTIVGGIVAYISLSFANEFVPYVLAVAASSFIYIAVADLIPGLHQRPRARAP